MGNDTSSYGKLVQIRLSSLRARQARKTFSTQSTETRSRKFGFHYNQAHRSQGPEERSAWSHLT
jgi:hypothetical protein